MLRIGDIIDHRYQLTRPLGVRNGAEMWEAEHRLTGRKVTLKVLPGDSDPLIRDRLVTEARVASEIGHPSVVEVYDVGIAEGGLAYLVTELLRGETLADIVARQGAMQAEDACQVVMHVLGGLEAAHAVNVVHGDLHADDIILRKGRSGQLVLKMLDFGRSPAPGKPEVQADIQAVGSILYELLTGRSARQGASPKAALGASQVPEVAQSFVPAIPQELARIVDEALAAGSPSAKGAIGSARQMAEQLAPFVDPERVPSLAPRETLMPFLSPDARKTRGMARLERAVLGLAEPKPSNRPNLFVIEGSQDNKVARITDRPSKLPQVAAARSLAEEDLIEPRIPRPPRTPRHIGGSVPRLIAAGRIDDSGHSRRRSSLPHRRWKASRKKEREQLGRPKGMSPVALRIWSAGLLAAAGLGAGLLLAHLLHF
jgi:serine/threonine protein kinase